MRVDLDAVASFSETGDEGGRRAAESLETMTGVAANCDLTRTTLVDADGLEAFLGDEPTRFEVEFGGALSGRAYVSFDGAFARNVADELAMGEAALPEIANILTSGFVDVWAERAPDTIDIHPPVEVEDDESLAPDASVVDGAAFVFESQVTFAGAGECRFAVVPDAESFAEFLAADDDAMSWDGLSAYLRLASESAANVQSHLAAMTGVDAELVESHVDFVPVERVPSLLDDAAYEGAVFESEGAVESVIAILFDEAEPGAVAGAMLGDDPDPDLAESAVAELGNVTASGFLDEWANALDTTIDVSTPSHVRDDGRAVLDTVAAAYGRHADTIAVVNTTVALGDDLVCRVCAFPNPEDADTLGEIAAALDANAGETE
ncbi:chemotaxis protein CheC [Halobacterium litoreum]|uniref:Chemotaxis protein CheC n=1 Tax=Halobacterium litoreum TaxID=2039234 RepID=A0ABD5N9T7_9EURY|nr:chemotaxis protein CheC [Halobacterium litoreum]UHH12011.1 chemotaxis protein CheC [Halobacterium litoreum]